MSCVVIIMCSEDVEYVFLRYFEGVDSVCFSYNSVRTMCFAGVVCRDENVC